MEVRAVGREMSFEEALEALEAVVHDLEEGELGLEASIGRYEEGIGIVKRCLQILREAEGKVEILTRDLTDRAAFEPFDAGVASGESDAPVPEPDADGGEDEGGESDSEP